MISTRGRPGQMAEQVTGQVGGEHDPSRDGLFTFSRFDPRLLHSCMHLCHYPTSLPSLYSTCLIDTYPVLWPAPNGPPRVSRPRELPRARQFVEQGQRPSKGRIHRRRSGILQVRRASSGRRRNRQQARVQRETMSAKSPQIPASMWSSAVEGEMNAKSKRIVEWPCQQTGLRERQ